MTSIGHVFLVDDDDDVRLLRILANVTAHSGLS